MISGGVLLALFLLALGVVCAVTLVTVVRGGRGPGEPPASHPGGGPGFLRAP